MREFTEEEIKLLNDPDCIRNNINRLDSKKDKTPAEQELLDALLDYRQKHYSYPSLAYYDVFELAQLFD